MSKPNTYFVRKFDIQFSLYLFQAPSNSVETPPETLKKLVEEGKEQVSISPILYEELLHVQIPKAQKNSRAISLFALLDSASVKALRKMSLKSTPGRQRQ